MLDQFNRTINYMRLSITDRCNLRCTYCRTGFTKHVSHDEILRYEELLRIAQAAVALGITRFKVTGGEPLVRKGCVDFIAALKRLPGVEQVTMTTNGTLFAPYAKALAEVGLDCVNFSLDTLRPSTYSTITGGNIKDVLDGIEQAAINGIRFKLNSVVQSDTADEDLLQLVKFSSKYDVPFRFIEKMPLHTKVLSEVSSAKSYFLQQSDGRILNKGIYQRLVRLFGTCSPVQDVMGNGPAVYYRVSNAEIGVNHAVIGLIEPIHNKFCADCNRVRLTATGQLKTCLYAASELDVRQLVRSGCSDEVLRDELRKAIFKKPLEHHFEEKPANFSMHEVGG